MKPNELEQKLLHMLSSGVDFEVAMQRLGDSGIKAAWDCILKGWVSGGRITKEGRSFVTPALTSTGTVRTTKFEIIDLGREGKPS